MSNSPLPSSDSSLQTEFNKVNEKIKKINMDLNDFDKLIAELQKNEKLNPLLTLSGPTLKFYMEEWDKFVIFPRVWS